MIRLMSNKRDGVRVNLSGFFKVHSSLLQEKNIPVCSRECQQQPSPVSYAGTAWQGGRGAVTPGVSQCGFEAAGCSSGPGWKS
jgi:hypothetical protein